MRSILETTLSALMLVALMLLTAALIISFGHAYPLQFVVIALAAAAIIMLYRHRHRSSCNSLEQNLSWPHPHPGILVNKFAPAGLPGLAFVLGGAFIFWFGVPGYQPIIVGIVCVGVVFGIILIIWRRS
ncbi:MAG: hypothetical protein JXO72_11260 [Vicinamibacteria bacterium]|nr:hypothetical protein [Vicinamibacteria bacterium]